MSYKSQKKSIKIGDKIFTSVTELRNYTREVLEALGVCTSVKSKNMDSYDFLLELSQRHPHFKLDSTVDFQIVYNPMSRKALQLEIKYDDSNIINGGTTQVISWVTACCGYTNKYDCKIKF